jgi:hypothetical protein
MVKDFNELVVGDVILTLSSTNQHFCPGWKDAWFVVKEGGYTYEPFPYVVLSVVNHKICKILTPSGLVSYLYSGAEVVYDVACQEDSLENLRG